MNEQATNLLAYVDPTERQREFIDAWRKRRFVLFGGAAGPGKSYMLRWSLVLFLVWLFSEKRIAKARVALFCEDYPSLYDRQISKIEAEFPSWLGRLRRGETKEFVLSDDYGGGAILLRNLDDPSKYLSAEFAAIAVDELTRNPVQTFNDLRLRLRWPGVDRPIFIAATNPGGEGHGWVKKYWIDRTYPAELLPYAQEFGFVRALPTDNPHLTAQYWKDLATLPEHMRKPYLEGDWNVLAGQYFPFDVASYKITPPKIEKWWPKWISGDWGWKHPMVWHWHARAEDGRILTYREWYTQQFDENRVGEELTNRSVRQNPTTGKDEPEDIDSIFFSPDAWAERNSQNTIAEQVNKGLGKRMPHVEQADDDRIGGARLMYNLLKSGMWSISEACPKLLECLPEMIHGEDKSLEDVLKVDWSPGHIGDDPYDSARYGLKSYLRQGTVPFEVRIDQKVEAAQITDPTSEMIWRSKWEATERRKMKPVHFGRRHH